MPIQKEQFGTLSDGRKADMISLDNGVIKVKLMNLGANLYSLFVPDRNGKLVDISLGLSTAQEYVNIRSSFGMTVGPVANRVSNACFTLNGKAYQLEANNHGNTLHSAGVAVQYKIWNYETGEDSNSVWCKFTIECPDGEGGWPANRVISVTYTLKEKTLCLDYHATADQDTYFNLTNHSYFNLSGNGSHDVLDYDLKVNSEKYTEVLPPGLIPTGKLFDVDETTDFRVYRKIGAKMPSEPVNGYDHFYVVDKYPKFRQFADVICPETGIHMETWSDLPGMQLYTANTQGKHNTVDKYGNTCCDYCAICLETALFTDSPNKKWPVSAVFGKNKPFDTHTEYRF